MKEMFTFEGLPMVIVVAMVAWSWIVFFSVLLFG